MGKQPPIQAIKTCLARFVGTPTQLLPLAAQTATWIVSTIRAHKVASLATATACALSIPKARRALLAPFRALLAYAPMRIRAFAGTKAPPPADTSQEAVKTNNIDAVQALIRQDASATLAGEQGNTAIHLSIGDNATSNPTEQDICTRVLLRATGNLGLIARNRQGQTALHTAAIQGNYLITEYLLRRGADINARDHKGNTPLHYATSKPIRDKLLQHGADFSLINYAGATPISRNFHMWHEITGQSNIETARYLQSLVKLPLNQTSFLTKQQ